MTRDYEHVASRISCPLVFNSLSDDFGYYESIGGLLSNRREISANQSVARNRARSRSRSDTSHLDFWVDFRMVQI